MSGGPSVREPEGLTPAEKETILKFSKDGEASVFSEQRGVCQRLLRHPEAIVKRLTLRDGRRIESADSLAESDTVTAVKATVPVEVVKIQRQPRGESATLADVVAECYEVVQA